MHHTDYAAEARELQRLIDEALERRQYDEIPRLSRQLVERVRKAFDSARPSRQASFPPPERAS